MKARAIATLSVTLALILPAVAQAGLPKTGNTLIVPAHSLGGVTLGSNSKGVIAAWGKTKECEYQCVYEGGKPGELGSVLLEGAQGAIPKVARVFITVAEVEVGAKTKPEFNTPLTRFKTAKGIGLGSSLAELRRAYPAVKREGSVNAGIATYGLAGPKESSTEFIVGPYGIQTVIVSAHPGG